MGHVSRVPREFVRHREAHNTLPPAVRYIPKNDGI